jgi:hypothetical protein
MAYKGNATRVSGRLLDVYVFSIAYQVPSLKLATTIVWQQFYGAIHEYADPYVVCVVCERAPLSSGLVQYLIAQYAYEIQISDVQRRQAAHNTLPSEFLVEVIIAVLRRAEETPPPPNPDNRLCDFHEHKSVEEKTICRDRSRS